ncbi:MAG: T9SS type A sorting domain-containing protein [Bacteroidetes bacterium]|nr:T9SS type A sorting domain-containing protein [Bacteroidota bacterium]
MKTKSTIMLLWLLAMTSTQFSFAQDAKFSMAHMPPYVQELQRGRPSPELLQTNPALYNHLMKRYIISSGMLQKEVAENRLPKEALQVLNIPAPNKIKNQPVESIKKATGNFNLVKDINTMTSSNPDNWDFDFTPSFAVLNNVIYFSADDGIHGYELWRSDGTAVGTYMVKDIYPGETSGNAQYITVYKNKLYFMAYDSTAGYELFKSDGTESGTKLVKDIIPGIYGSQPQHFTIVNNLLFFTTTDVYYHFNSQIWRTDGTTSGTIMVADLYASNAAYNIGQLTAVGTNLFFTAYNYTYGRELWKTDGATTYLVKDINLYNDNSYLDFDGPANLTSFNNLLYFSANNGYIRTLWQSDGTYSGTNIVANQNGITLNSIYYYGPYEDQPFAIAKNSLFFAGTATATGTELYKFNPSNSDGIVLVKDISTGSVSSALFNEQIASMNDSIYFITPDFTGKIFSLWKSGGTAASTKIVKTLDGVFNSNTLYSLGNKLYFNIGTKDNGYEPWVSDGTAAGTKMIKDIISGSAPSSPVDFTLLKGKVYFAATSLNQGNELWVTNGTPAGTKTVLDINTTSTGNGALPFGDSYIKALNADKIVFNGYQYSSGDELWKSNGTAAGTSMIKDLYPGFYSSSPQFYDVKNGKAYFRSLDSMGNENINVTDGSSANTKRLLSTPNYIYDLKVADNGIVFYTIYNNGYQVWRTDSSGNNIQLSNSGGRSDLAVAGNICLFQGYNGYGYELWKSDGTQYGTNLIADLYPGSGSSSPYSFTNFGDKVLFTAYNGSGSYLYITDGTVGGTKQLSTTITPNLYNGGAELNNKFYFDGYEPAVGYELYVTNGTVSGTKMVKDINTGSNGSNPANFTTVGNSIYFSGADATHGSELWKSTGTASSTKMVKDITAGTDGSYIYEFTSAGGKLFFLKNDSLWSSDGTSAGTKAVNDAGLAGVDYFYNLLAAGDKLFIQGYDYKYGYELYEGDATASNFSANAIAKTIDKPELSAQLATNPFNDELRININSPSKQQLKIQVSNATGQPVANQIIDVTEGQNIFSVYAASWSHGIYFVNIKSPTGNVSLKAMK